MFQQLPRRFFLAVVVIGALLLVSGVAGPPRIPVLGHLCLMLAGIVLASIGFVGALRPRPRPMVAAPAAAASEPPRPQRIAPEPRVFAEPGDGLQLRDARIDEDGAVFGAGWITFPSSTDGLFVPAEGTEVRLVADDAPLLRLTACRTTRDARTGYLVAEPVGPTLQFHAQVGDLLLQCLRHPPGEPRAFELDGTGVLWTGAEEHRIEQGLEGIRGTIALEDEHVRIDISAELRTAGWFPTSVGQREHWEDAPGCRVELHLVLDPLTRVVRFGGYAKGFAEGHPYRLPVVPPSRGDQQLSTAPIGVLGALYGIRDDGRLVDVHDRSMWNSAPALHLSGPRPAQRDPSGLVASLNTWPRTRITGIDLGIVATMLSPARPRFAVDLRSDVVGYIEYSGGGSDGPGPGADLLEASLEFRVVEDGVRFSYTARADGNPEVADELLLRWEALTIRASGFARLRRALGRP